MAKQLNVSLAFSADTSQAKQQIADLQTQLSALTNTLGSKKTTLGLTKELVEAAQAVATLKANLNSAMNVDTGKLDLSKFQQAMNASGMSLQKYQTQLNSLGPAGKQAFASLANSLTTAEIPLRRTSTLLSGMWTTLKNTARWQISSMALHGFMSTISGAYSYAQKLNESLNNIRIVTGQSTDQMAQFAAQANKAAQALSTTTTNYTNAALIFYQQGLKGTDVTDRTDVAIKLANVTGQTASEISDQMTAIWNNFDNGSESLEHYADVITNLGAHTASSSKEIAEGLGKFAAVADTVGLSYDYATTALATVVAETRQSADVVGTAFKTMFSRMEQLKQGGVTEEDGTTLGKYSQALANVGVNIKDASGQLKNMDQILDETGAKWQTLARDQQVALAQTVAGVRQYSQFIALMDNWDTFQSNLGYAQDADGTLQKQADTYAESWAAAKTRVKAAAQDIYSALLDDKFFIKFNNGLASVIQEIKVVIDSFGGLKGILLMLGSLATTVFADKVTANIQNAIYSIQMLTKAGKASVEAVRTEANDLLIKNTTSQGGVIGQSMGTAYKEQAVLQQAYLASVEKMDPLQKAISEEMLAQQQMLIKNVELQAQQVQELEKQEKFQRRVIQKDINNNLSSKDANRAQKELKQLEASLPTVGKIKASFEQIGNIEIVPKNLPILKQQLEQTGLTAQEFALAFGQEGEQAFLRLNEVLAKETPAIEEVEIALGDLWTVLLSGNGPADSFKQLLINTITEGLDPASNKYKEIVANIENYCATLEKTGGATVDLGNKQSILKDYTEQTASAIQKLQASNTGAIGSMVSLAGTISSVAMGINTIVNLIDTWNNKDLSGGKKLLTTFISLGMVIPMVTKAVNADTLANILNLGAKLRGAKGSELLTIAQTAEAGSAAAAAAATWTLLWPILAITAAIAALVAIVYLINAAYNANANAAKNAAETADTLAEDYNEAKDAFDSLKESIENYNDALDGLSELTKGTDEFKDAIKSANSQARELIDTYDELAGKYKYNSETGLIEFDKGALEELQNNEERKLSLAERNSINASNTSLYAQNRLKNEQLTRKNDKSYGDYLVDNGKWALGGATTAIAGGTGALAAAMGGVTLGLAATTAAEFATIIGPAAVALDAAASGIQMWAQEDKNKEQQRALERLEELYGENNQDYEAAFNKLPKDMQDILSEFDNTALAELCSTIQANTDALIQNNKQLIDDWYQDNEAYTDANNKDALNTLLSSKYTNSSKDNYENLYKDQGFLGWFTAAFSDDAYTDVEIRKMYAEAMGYSTTSIKNNSGNTATYYDADGNEVGTISDEAARRFLAAQDAQENLDTEVENIITAFNKLYDAGAEISEEGGNAFSSFTEGNKGNFKNLSKGDFESLNIDALQLTDEEAQALGWDNVAKLKEAMQEAKDSIDWDSLNLPDNILGIDKISYESGEKLSALYEKANLLGEKGGQSLIDGFNLVMANVDPDDQAAALDALTNIDWTDWNASSQAVDALKALDIEVDTTSDAWKNFIANMKLVNNAIPDFNSLKQDLTTIHELTKDLTFGSTVDQEGYDTLIAKNAQLKDSFIALADGTYKYIGTEAELHEATMQQIQDDLAMSRTRAKAAESFENVKWTDEKGNDVDWGDVSTKEASDQYFTDLGQNILASDSTMSVLEQIGYDQATVEELAKTTDGVKLLAQALDGLNNAPEESQQLEEMLASTAQSIPELTRLLNEGTIGQDAYDKAIQSVAGSAIQAAGSLSDLNLAIQQSQDAGIDVSYDLVSSSLINMGAQYDNCVTQVGNYQQALEKGNQEQIALAEGLLKDAIYAGEMAKQYDLSADTIERYAQDLAATGKYAGVARKQLMEMAKDQLRYDKAVESTNTNLETWTKDLKVAQKTGHLVGETAEQMAEAYGNLLDLDAGQFSSQFLQSEENLQLMKAAINGDEEAYRNLLAAANEDFTEGIRNSLTGDDLNEFNTKLQEIQNQLDSLNFENLDASASLNNQPFLDSLTEMVNAANMTAEEATSYLSSMGIDAEVTTEPEEIEEIQAYNITPNVTRQTYGEDATQINVPTVTYDTEPVTTKKQVAGTALKVTSANKSSGGKVKHSGSTAANGGSNSGKKGGGSSNKVDKKDSSSRVERYKEIDDSLDELSRSMDKVNKAEDRLYGNAKIANLQKQNKLLAQQISLNSKKISQAKDYLALDKAALDTEASKYNITFDYNQTGNITNYDEVMGGLEKQLNNKIAEYNKSFEGTTNSDAAKDYEEKYIKPLEDQIDGLQKLIDQYDETNEVIREYEDQNEEIFQQWQDNNYDIITTKLQNNLQLLENEVSILDYYFDKLSDDVYKAAEALTFLLEKVDVSTDTLSAQSAAWLELQDAYDSGEISQAAYVEGLQSCYDSILKELSALKQLDDQMMDYYGNTLDKALEEIDKYTSRMNNLNTVLDHYQKILELTGNAKNYKAIKNIQEAMAQNNKNLYTTSKATYESLMSQQDEIWKNYQEALARGDTAAAELYAKQLDKNVEATNEAYNTMLENAESYMESLKSMMETTLEEISEKYEDTLTGGLGFDALTASMDRVSTRQDEYLTKTNQIYETNKMLRTLQNDIDKTSNTVAKQKLANFSQEIAAAKEQNELSNLELKILQAKYAQLQAEIALEEAQNAKSTVRMQRDSEGNYGYVYTADQGAIDDAEQNLENTINNLYNIRLEAANNYSSLVIQTEQAMQNALKELWADENLSLEEKEIQAAQIVEEYSALIESYQDLYGIATEEDSRVVADAWSTAYSDIVTDTETWKTATDQYNVDTRETIKTTEQAIDNFAKEADLDLGSIETATKDVKDESQALADTLIDEVVPAMDTELDSVLSLTSEYANMRGQIQGVTADYEAQAEALRELIALQTEALNASYDDEDFDDEGGDSDVSGATGPGAGSGSGSGSGSPGGSQPVVDKTKDSESWKYSCSVLGLSNGGYSSFYAAGRAGADAIRAKGFEGVTYNYIVSGPGTSQGLTAQGSQKKSSGSNPAGGYTNPLSGKYIDSATYRKLGAQYETDKYEKKYKGLTLNEYLKAKGYDTGGYTGNWGNSEGKLALLHEKELVLNKEDTQNMLAAIDVVRQISNIIDLNAAYASGMNSFSAGNIGTGTGGSIDQNVTITAEFPNATDKNEIEEAFKSLINYSSQYANRK